MNTASNIMILLSSICMSSTAHVFLKRGSSIIQQSSFINAQALNKVIIMTTSPWIISGMAMHVCALVIWLWALSRVDITFAYPFLALGFVLVSLLAYFWIGENMPLLRIVGMMIIILGMYFICKSG